MQMKKAFLTLHSALTGLYLALAAFWLYAAFNEKYGEPKP